MANETILGCDMRNGEIDAMHRPASTGQRQRRGRSILLAICPGPSVFGTATGADVHEVNIQENTCSNEHL